MAKQEILELLLSGTDERTKLNKVGLSPYGINFADASLTNKGSCTCNHITEKQMEYLLNIVNEIHGKMDWLNLINYVQDRLKAELSNSNHSNFEVFLGPSGTDLLYYPLLFSLECMPNKKILNIITCIEELGSGTVHAGQGKYFAGINQFDQKISKGDSIISSNQIEVAYLKARCHRGLIRDSKNQLRNLIESNPSKSIIINLVLGSKSGIEDDLSFIDEVDKENVFWNVDMCQFRHNPEVIERLTSKGVSVMITGSKFYQAPPFCGAILIPKQWIKRINSVEKLYHFNLFRHVFSKFDLPDLLRKKTNLPEVINKGLVLRWLLALNSINDLSKIGWERTMIIIKNWNRVVKDELSKYEEFALMPDEEKTIPSIISFQVKGKEGFLTHEEMRSLFFSIVENKHENLPTQRVFIGQPVAYGDKSFIRLAIGAEDVMSIHHSGESELSVEKGILKVIRERILAIENTR